MYGSDVHISVGQEEPLHDPVDKGELTMSSSVDNHYYDEWYSALMTLKSARARNGAEILW